MAQITVNFTFHSGIRHKLFPNVRLSGSWDADRAVFQPMD